VSQVSKQNPNWSASRFGTFSGCKNKYKLTYIDSLVVVGKDSELASKGISFHSIAEAMDSSKTIDEITKEAVSVLSDTTFDQEKYPVLKSIPRFFLWWKEYVTKFEDAGYKLSKENWERGEILGNPIVGAIDLLLINYKTKEYRIYDYKTGATAKIAGYENQLLLYAWMVGKRLELTDDEIAEKCKLYVFFPLAGLKDETPDNTEKMMLKNMKQLVFTTHDIEETINFFSSVILESEKTDWDKFDPVANSTMSFACSFCGFCGNKDYCSTTYTAGLRFPRKAKVMTKAEAKELK
jgi:hypothetical protein